MSSDSVKSEFDQLQASCEEYTTTANSPSVASAMMKGCLAAVKPLLVVDAIMGAPITVLDTSGCRRVGRDTNMAYFVSQLIQRAPDGFKIGVLCMGLHHARSFIDKLFVQLADEVLSATMTHTCTSMLRLTRGREVMAGSVYGNVSLADCNVAIFMCHHMSRDIFSKIVVPFAVLPGTSAIIVDQLPMQPRDDNTWMRIEDYVTTGKDAVVVVPCKCECKADIHVREESLAQRMDNLVLSDDGQTREVFMGKID